MIGAYPLAFRPEEVKLRGWSPTLVSVPHSLKSNRRSRGSHRWAPTLVYGACLRDEYAPIVGFVDELRGQFETCTIVLPGWAEAPRGVVAGAPLVNGAHAKGAQQVNVDGLALGTNNVWRAGDLVKFANHAKLYEVTRDANSNGAGQAALTLNCPLQAALADNEGITYANVPMTVRLVADTFDRAIRGGLLCRGFEVALIEEP